MSKELEKFVKNLSSLENYCVLASEKHEIIVGTLLTFTEVKKIGGGAYSFHGVYEKQIERTLPVFFIVSFSNQAGAFKLFSCPVLYLNKERIPKTSEETQVLLEEFISENF